jgi:RNA polymerase primary sigma factor
MPKGHTATKPKPAPARAGARPSASRVAPKTVISKAAAPKPAAAKTVIPKAAAPKVPPAVHKKNGDKGMASKSAAAVKAKVNDKELPEKEKDTATPETPDSPLPLLDLSDAAVKKMIKQAKKRGYVTHEQLNAVLPSEEVSSDQIEDIYAMLNEMCNNVVEQ